MMKFSFQTVCLLLIVTFAHLAVISVVSSVRGEREPFTDFDLESYVEEQQRESEQDEADRAPAAEEAAPGDDSGEGAIASGEPVPENPLRGEAGVPPEEPARELGEERLFAGSGDEARIGPAGPPEAIEPTDEAAVLPPEGEEDTAGGDRTVRAIRPIPRS